MKDFSDDNGNLSKIRDFEYLLPINRIIISISQSNEIITFTGT